jgi:hypothetical protein
MKKHEARSTKLETQQDTLSVSDFGFWFSDFPADTGGRA